MITAADLRAHADALEQWLVRMPGSTPPAARECVQRTVVSKHYYAVFIRASELARILGYVKPEGRGTHEALWQYLGENGYAYAAGLGVVLHQWRVEADYKTGLDFRRSLEDVHDRLKPLNEQLDLAERDFEKRAAGPIAP